MTLRTAGETGQGQGQAVDEKDPVGWFGLLLVVAGVAGLLSAPAEPRNTAKSTVRITAADRRVPPIHALAWPTPITAKYPHSPKATGETWAGTVRGSNAEKAST